MSPFVLDRNVPLIGLPKGGQIGADRNEQGGVRKSGSAGAGAEQVGVHSPVGRDAAVLRGPDECVHRAPRLKEQPPFATVSRPRRRDWARDLPINNRTRAPFAASIFRVCHAEIRNDEMAEQTSWRSDSCALRCRRPDASRPLASKRLAGAS